MRIFVKVNRMHFNGRPAWLAPVSPFRFVSLMLAALLMLPAASFAKVSGDFDGDGKSDILWRNGTGLIEIWLMNGTSLTVTGSPGNVNPTVGWNVEGVGDFDGDGKADIVWRNINTGQVYIWLMNGTAIASSGSPGSATLDWAIQGVGDFNGDGKADILWQNSKTGQVYIWEMDGTTIAGQGSPATEAQSTGWVIQGVGDFNGDGDADILWQNSVTGQLDIWLMNGLTIASTGSPGTESPASGWVVQGVGDFNGDKNADILWQNSSTGQLYVWLMNGTSLVSSGTPGSEAQGTGWTIAGVGDFNGDGDADIVWSNGQTGQVFVWLMNGTSLASSGSPGTATLDWAVAPVYAYSCPGGTSPGSGVCPMVAAMNAVRTNGPFPTAANVWGPSSGTPNPAPVPPLLPLTWSPTAAVNAQAWAATCNYNTNGPHNPDLGTAGMGENVAAGAGSDFSFVTTGTGNGLVSEQGWTNEAGNWTYGTIGGTEQCTADECGHYTQEVWRNTTAIGCAVQICTTNSPFGSQFPYWYFAVCDFIPAGNFEGETPY
jgi:Cysteine-rich secretory protein family/FG-GAP-like repeat